MSEHDRAVEQGLFASTIDRQRFLKGAAAAGLAAGAVPAGIARAAAPRQTSTISLMVTASWWPPIMDQIAKAAATATGVTVNVQKLPEGNQGKVVIETKLAAHNLSDMIAWAGGSAFLTQLNPPQNLLPITDQPYTKSLLDAVKPAMSYNGQVYGIPDSANGWGFEGIFYNKPLFAKLHLSVPQTEAQFWAVCAAIKKVGKVPFWISSKDAWSDTQVPEDYWPWIFRKYPNAIKQILAKKLHFADIPEWVAALGFTKQIADKGYSNPNFTTATYDQGVEALVNGEVAMYAQGTWMFTNIQTSYPQHLNDIGFFPQPIDGHNLVAISPPQAFFINKNTSNAAAVHKWLSFYVTQGQTIYYAHQQGFPMFKNVKSTLPPTMQQIQTLVAQGKAGSNEQSDLPVMFPNWEPTVQAAFAGNLTPKAAAQALDQSLGQALQQIGYPGW